MTFGVCIGRPPGTSGNVATTAQAYPKTRYIFDRIWIQLLGDFTHNRRRGIKLCFRQRVDRLNRSVCDDQVMAKQCISEDLRKFLREKIQTVLRLEVLLVLHNQQPRALTAPEVANRLGFENETTAHELVELEAIGVVVQSKSDKTKYMYHPPNESVRSLIEQLALDYPKHRVPILTIMLAEHPDRTRLFTEAFKIIRRND